MRAMRCWALAALVVALGLGCGESGTGPPVLETTDMTVSYENLAALDAGEFAGYEAWVVDSWFRDNGEDPDILDLQTWKDGWKPEGFTF